VRPRSEPDAVLRLAFLILAAVLLGLPRALRGGASVARAHSVYVEVAPGDPSLAAFGAALEAELEREHFAPAESPTPDTLIVEIHGVATLRARDGKSRQAITITLREQDRSQRLVLDYGRGNVRAAARTLIASLPARRRQAH
jgi:hypothetical protein